MAKSPFVPPNIENVTDGAMVDEIGKIKMMAKYCKFMEGFYKEALYGRLGRDAQVLPAGEKYGGSVSVEARERIVPDLVREKFTEEQVASVTSSSDITVMRITPTTVDLIELDKNVKNLMMELGLDDDETY